MSSATEVEATALARELELFLAAARRTPTSEPATWRALGRCWSTPAAVLRCLVEDGAGGGEDPVDADLLRLLDRCEDGLDQMARDGGEDARAGLVVRLVALRARVTTLPEQDRLADAIGPRSPRAARALREPAGPGGLGLRLVLTATRPLVARRRRRAFRYALSRPR